MSDPAGPPFDLVLPDGGPGCPILDGASLPRGGVILGLGEAGAAVYQGGQRIARFEAAAHHLAVSDDGRKVIAIGQAPDEERCCFARIDLERGKEAPWCERPRNRTHRFARTFDRKRWYTARERGLEEIRVEAVDPTAPDFSVLQRVEEEGLLVGLERAGDRLWVESSSIGAGHFALYALPSLEVIAKGDIRCPKIRFPPRPGQPFELFAGSALPPLAAEPVFAVGGPSCVEPRLMGAPGTWAVPLPAMPMGPSALRAHGSWVSVTVEDEGGSRVMIMDLRSRSWVGSIRMPSARAAGVELREGAVLAWDDRGRAVEVDLLRGEVSQMVQVDPVDPR